MNIFWFRRDLRTKDNASLFHALNSDEKVLPIFIFDNSILDELEKNDARVNFIHNQLVIINNELQKCEKSLAVFYGKPKDIFEKLLAENKVNTVFTNHDYEPYARKRDKEVYQIFKENNINFKTSKDQVVFEKNEITKSNGLPYMVYTPFMKAWKEKFKTSTFKHYPSETLLQNFVQITDLANVNLSDMGFEVSNQKVQPYHVDSELIQNYEAMRNFPAQDATSKLGPHLRFGTVSIRKMVAKAIAETNEIFWQELIWREFFMQILWHFPHTVTQSFKPQYDRIEWRNNKTEFELWCEGKTGYPLVDAGMRQLNQTGFMHNRVRMLVGSFLCKHLLVDWRWGEAYFAEKLHDYDMASNIGNWQWVAGCGVDAAPYFRIFNPTTQIEKFDKNLEYIKQWCPDFQELAYPTPIVDHTFARERCLQVYKAALS